jgi:hypothetical protein
MNGKGCKRDFRAVGLLILWCVGREGWFSVDATRGAQDNGGRRPLIRMLCMTRTTILRTCAKWSVRTGSEPKDHFPGIRKMVDLGSGATREIEDIALTRYAC